MMNIPLPGQPGEAFSQGINTGTNLYNTMMHPRLTREQHQLQNYMQTQRMAQEKMLEEARLAQAWQQHLQNLAIHQSQESRLQALHPYQLQNLQAQIAHENAKAQEIQRNQEMINQLLSGNFGQQQPQVNQPDFQPYRPPQQQQFPGVQGMSNMSPMPQMPNFQAPPTPQAGMNVPNRQAIVEGLAKKNLGFNPFEKTEEQKAEQKMNEFVTKENIKQQMKGQEDLTRPTTSTVTSNQEVINAGNSLLPILQKLRDEESYSFFSPPSGGKAKYKTRAGISTDKLMTALKLPKQKESIELVKQMTHRQPFESPEEFQDRIDMLMNEIVENIKLAENVVTKGKVQANTTLVYNPKTGNIE